MVGSSKQAARVRVRAGKWTTTIVNKRTTDHNLRIMGQQDMDMLTITGCLYFQEVYLHEIHSIQPL